MDHLYDFPVQLQPIYLEGNHEIKDRKAVVRTDTMQTLGIVSNDYELVKHATVVDALREAGSKYGIKEKISMTNHGGYLFYQMIFPKVEGEVRKGDIVRLMLIAKNSYNGQNSVQLIFGAYRLVCLNGMVIGTKFMQFAYRHVGSVGGLNNTNMIDDYTQAYKQQIQLFSERLPQLSAMAGKNVSRPGKLFTRDAAQLPEYLLTIAKDSYQKEKDKTVWGYYNALTFAITHQMRKENPRMTLKYGVEAWKAAERIMH